MIFGARAGKGGEKKSYLSRDSFCRGDKTEKVSLFKGRNEIPVCLSESLLLEGKESGKNQDDITTIR